MKQTKLSLISSSISLLIFPILCTLCSSLQAQERAAHVYSYKVAGEILRLPKPQDQKLEIIIRHEAIPDYVDDSGAKVGMPAMTMTFTLSPKVALDSLTVGEQVQFVLESWWKPKPGDEIVEIKKITERQNN